MKRLVLIGFAFLFLIPLRAQEPDPQYKALTDTVTRLCGQVLTGGNRIEYTKSGEEFLAWLLEDVESARETIDLEYYWFDKDSAATVLTDALLKKVQEGVKVRLLMDNLVMPTAPKFHYNRLREAGLDIRYVHNFRHTGVFKTLWGIVGERDHRKLVVIDSHIAYTGGMNICNEIFDWADTQARVEGPVAAAIRRTFADDWAISGGEPFEVIEPAQNPSYVHMQAFATDRKHAPDALYIAALDSAKEYFYAQTPYFSPPKGVLDALKAAADRGVDVRLLLPERSDHGFMNELSRDYFEELLAAGISVSLYGGAYDHSKIFVSDSFLTCVSTLNLDKRSFHINREMGILIFDQDVAEDVTASFLAQEAECYSVKEGESVGRGIHKPYRVFLRAISPLL